MAPVDRPISGGAVLAVLAVAALVPAFPYWSAWLHIDPVAGLIRGMDGDLMAVNATILGLSGAVMAAAVAVALQRRGWRSLEFLPFRRHWLVTGPALLLVVSVVTALFQGEMAEAVAEVTAAAVAPGEVTPSGVLFMLAGAGILAPLGEEMVFRGLLYPWLKGRFGVPAAIIASGVLFGLFHVHPDLAVRAMALGIALGFIRERAGSLWPCVAAHAVNNSLAVLVFQAVKLAG